jgi:hypothetical protein
MGTVVAVRGAIVDAAFGQANLGGTLLAIAAAAMETNASGA